MKSYKYIGVEHPSHTGKKVKLMGEQFGALRVQILDEHVKVEGMGALWTTSILCNWEDLEVVEE
jgi:hypothetical protein